MAATMKDRAAVAAFLTERSRSKLSKLGDAVVRNIQSWPSHIAREPLLNLAEIYMGEKLPVHVGFPALSLRVLTEAGGKAVDGSTGWKAGDVLLCLPLIGSAFQPAVTASQLNTRGIHKYAIPWKVTHTREATPEEALGFVREAFGTP